ncbi:hypothetical protein HYW74_01840 [Candidatus Pacearchaeota archaeon]|nr:hypothetical protein [Candidatus Pacearchaeota archaeon]
MEEQIEESKSIFREYFGDSPYIRILDFLIQGQDFDYSMTEIARKSEVGWNVFTKVWARLLEKNIIVQTRTIGNAKLFKLNKENIFVKKLIKFDQELTKLETDNMLSNISKKKIVA